MHGMDTVAEMTVQHVTCYYWIWCRSGQLVLRNECGCKAFLSVFVFVSSWMNGTENWCVKNYKSID